MGQILWKGEKQKLENYISYLNTEMPLGFLIRVGKRNNAVGIGLTETQNSVRAKAHPAHPPTAPLNCD